MTALNTDPIADARVARHRCLTEDDGTARDKVTRVQRLEPVSVQRQWQGEPSFEVVACSCPTAHGCCRSTLDKTVEVHGIAGRTARAGTGPRSCRLASQDGSGELPVPAGHHGRSLSAVFRPQAADVAYGSSGRGMR